MLGLALALSIAACGESSSDANEASGTFHVKVAKASFPTSQQIGQTYLMRLGIRNTGSKVVPALIVNVSVAGKEGRTSTLPFAIHDPQPELAQPDRPVWVLAAHYPKFAGSAAPGGAETSNQKTYDFGPLKPGATDNLVWKLSAVKAGRFGLLYAIDAGLGSQVKAKTASGIAPGGSFTVDIGSAPYDTEVAEGGEVVPRRKGREGATG
ncbi:MAG TPA: hypothetical protein VGH58_11945 [Solirubrobacterales bacterium]